MSLLSTAKSLKLYAESSSGGLGCNNPVSLIGKRVIDPDKSRIIRRWPSLVVLIVVAGDWGSIPHQRVFSKKVCLHVSMIYLSL